MIYYIIDRLKDSSGNLYHDPGGGGSYDYINSKVINGGHVWFPQNTNQYLNYLINQNLIWKRLNFYIIMI